MVETRITLQEFLVQKFTAWTPPAPEVLARTKNTVSLEWSQVEPFQFIADQLLYRLEKNDKIPPWIVVYRGSKTKEKIIHLPPTHPHKFRLRVIVKAEAVHTLVDRALQFYGDEDAIYEKMAAIKEEEKHDESTKPRIDVTGDQGVNEEDKKKDANVHEAGESTKIRSRPLSANKCVKPKWLESRWSPIAWASTDTDGTSAKCFCMAVRCGYIKQVQGMLDERAELLSVLNPTNGFTALSTAVRKGDINAVRYLVTCGAEVDQPSATGQTPLHIALLTARLPIADFLLEKGASIQARDVNGLRAEHYAVDSCEVEVVRYILDKGGDVTVRDSNGWTPLFRALCQGAKTAIIEELVVRGSDVDIADKGGLPLTSVARIMTNRHGRNRDSVLRLVDMNYPREIALANFTRLTKKINNVHSLLKLPSLNKKPNLKN